MCIPLKPKNKLKNIIVWQMLKMKKKSINKNFKNLNLEIKLSTNYASLIVRIFFICGYDTLG